MRILVVEDQQKLAKLLHRGLSNEGYQVDLAADGETAEIKARTGEFDLIILDILLPQKNGFEVLKTLRSEKNRTPVLVLTARTASEEIVKGLDAGADDYITKPFAFNELFARVRSLLRRGAEAKTALKVADLQLDMVTHRATRKGVKINLTAREYAVLEYLMRNAGSVISRERIAQEVWGFEFDPGTNIVDVYVNHLRKKIDRGFELKLLHTIRGMGYLLSEDSGKIR